MIGVGLFSRIASTRASSSGVHFSYNATALRFSATCETLENPRMATDTSVFARAQAMQRLACETSSSFASSPRA